MSAPHDAVLVRGLLERQEAASREDFLAGTAHPASGAPAAGHRLGPWTIEAPLGEGGMASVWLARRSDGRHDGQAAIKLMHGRLHGTQASQRFEREGRILARLEHPHIARLLDAGVASDGEGWPALPGAGTGARRAHRPLVRRRAGWASKPACACSSTWRRPWLMPPTRSWWCTATSSPAT
jgi:serine/threonine protein kinase